jgi:hypothetical protein
MKNMENRIHTQRVAGTVRAQGLGEISGRYRMVTKLTSDFVVSSGLLACCFGGNTKEDLFWVAWSSKSGDRVVLLSNASCKFVTDFRPQGSVFILMSGHVPR